MDPLGYRSSEVTGQYGLRNRDQLLVPKRLLDTLSLSSPIDMSTVNVNRSPPFIQFESDVIHFGGPSPDNRQQFPELNVPNINMRSPMVHLSNVAACSSSSHPPAWKGPNTQPIRDNQIQYTKLATTPGYIRA